MLSATQTFTNIYQQFTNIYQHRGPASPPQAQRGLRGHSKEVWGACHSPSHSLPSGWGGPTARWSQSRPTQFTNIYQHLPTLADIYQQFTNIHPRGHHS